MCTMTDSQLINSKWIVCQIGAREHYAVARGLADRGKLEVLVTDAWAPFNGSLSDIAPRLAGRSHSGLDRDRVVAFTGSAIFRSAIEKLRHSNNQTTVNLRRNTWFQKKAAAWLAELAQREPGYRVIFSYSYAALDIFREARRHGWHTVLGQIDPGPAEARIVQELVDKHDPSGQNEAAKPEYYWQNWREETYLADRIIVNSAWSRSALIGEGVPEDKIEIIPLAYDRLSVTPMRVDTEPHTGSPLRVLFLGQAILRKGIVELTEAARLLVGERVEIHVVGPIPEHLSRRLLDTPGICWHGSQPRSRVDEFYRNSDVFILPTHSDGFGMTQLEAMAHGLPVISSTKCGEVVKDGENGLVLKQVDGENIAHTLRMLIENRDLLARLTEGARRAKISQPDVIAGRLIAAASENSGSGVEGYK